MTNDRADSVAFSHLAEKLLSCGIQIRFRARGRSMLPTIQDGDLLHVGSATRLGFADIVLFRQGAEFKAHRIIRKRAQSFITRGDAGLESDGEIQEGQIVGKVIAKECSQTGAIVSLHGARSRAGFFLRELRRLSLLCVLRDLCG